MMDIDESSLPSTLVKEERVDDDDFFDKKFETPKRGRSRSLSKKSVDKVDIRAKLERSRQSARECRARKKLRYQYLEELISETEKAIYALRREMDMLKVWGKDLDEGKLPDNVLEYRTAIRDKTSTDPLKLKQHRIQYDDQGTVGNVALSVSPSGDMTSYMTMMNLNRQSQSLSPP
ncbi:cAMP-responsive element-binding protein-like 2 [Folsomia candida]|uniref:cAMP-responsive element-binding protein-like 2 n=1 Tax=Folsomia candida TaxID=158441 RepID=A0A226ELP3_FOLCA|nr:cAMP-responsive element-binding protein-like 2 [Folsomia candida]OXA58057.1 cAMP-responsive element-binding protein-like 2 [Folsomia candida]